MRGPANFPALLQSFFTTRLMMQRKVSPHTIASYRDTFRLLLQFAQKRLRKTPSELGLDDLDACLVGAFLEDLENRRHNGARSRNRRLTATSACVPHPVVFPLRLAGSAGAQRNHPTSAGDSESTAATRSGGFSHPARDRGAAGGAESNEVAGTPRPRLSAHRRSDRPVIVRDDRIAARGCLARSRRTCALPGKRTKGTLYSLGQTNRHGPEKLDSGARQSRFQNAVPQHPRRTFERRWCSALAGTPRGAGAEELRFAAQETSLATCPAARRCHGVATGRRGSSGDCALARS
jgi:Phage integrase, N-terminal SAM-like domain